MVIQQIVAIVQIASYSGQIASYSGHTCTHSHTCHHHHGSDSRTKIQEGGSPRLKQVL